MKKASLIFMLLIATILVSQAQKVTTDLYEKGLKGRVKKYTDSINFVYTNGKSGTKVEYYAFDVKGFMTEECDGYQEETQKYKPLYDSRGRILQNKKRGWRYDKQGRVNLEYEVNQKGKMASKSIYEYNHTGKVKTRKFYRYGSTTHIFSPEVYTYTFSYDSKGRLIKSSSESDGSELIIYDKNTKTITYHGQYNKVVKKEIITYDENRNEIKRLMGFEENLTDLTAIDKQIQKFDNKNQLLETLYYRRGNKFIGRATYRYNNLGNLIEEMQIRPDGSAFRTETYTYDKKNNWVKKVVLQNGKVMKAIYRKIQYYNN